MQYIKKITPPVLEERLDFVMKAEGFDSATGTLYGLDSKIILHVNQRFKDTIKNSHTVADYLSDITGYMVVAKCT